MTILWPIRVLTPTDVDTPTLQPMPVSGPPAMSGGGGQIIQGDPGFWMTGMTFAVRTSQQIKLWRAIAGLLSGPVTPILVPCMDKRGPWPLDADGAEIRSYGSIPFDDGMLFDDGTGFYQPVIDATAAAASTGDTDLDITMNYGSEPEAGQFFSIVERLYKINTVGDVDDTDPDHPVYSCTITPPLREDVASGAAVEFDEPVCRMRLAAGSDMKLTLQMARFATPTLNFVEDL